ncbi:MAG: hypothetical protein M5U26_29195 [Planctomycetota bacterium]|nr:hypothetical protein [Planctomycetota bacterium]
MRMILLGELEARRDAQGRIVSMHGRETKAARWMIFPNPAKPGTWKLYRVVHNKAGDTIESPDNTKLCKKNLDGRANL